MKGTHCNRLYKRIVFLASSILVTLTRRVARNEESSLKDLYFKWEKMI